MARVIAAGPGGLLLPGQVRAVLPETLQNPPGLIGYWPFDADTGLLGDLTGRNTAAATAGGSTSLVAGQVGNAAAFNGANTTYVDTGIVPDAVRSAGSFAFWLKPTNAFNSGNQEQVAGADGIGTNHIDILHFSDNNLYIGWINLGSDQRIVTAASATNWIQGAWNHWVVTWEAGGNTLFYANGKFVASHGSTSIPTGFTDQNIQIGNQGISNAGFVGAIDDFRIYNRALAPSEAGALYNAGLQGSREIPLLLSQVFEFPAVAAANNNVSLTLSGSACAALAGSFADAMAITIAGASISCVAGVLNDNVAPAFPGAAASVSAGTLKDAVTVALAGAGSSISAGAFAAAVAKALTGTGASSAAGAFLEALALALTGAAASSAAGVFSDAILDALSGAVASCAAGTLSASSSSGGTVSLTGASATIAAGLFADAIARALTGASSSASAGVLSPGNALNLAIAGASANALAGSLSVTEVGAIAGGSANAAAGNLAELASIALSGAGVTAGAGIIGKAVTVAPSGAQIAALAGFIVATRPGQVGLFGAFARASAGILVVSAISGSTGIFAFLDVHGAMSSEEFNELAARTG